MPKEHPTQRHTQPHTLLTFWCVSSIYSLRSSASWPALTRFSSPSPFADTRTYTHNHNHIHSSPFGASQACESCQANALHRHTHNHIHPSPFGASPAYTVCAPVRPGPHSRASDPLPLLLTQGHTHTTTTTYTPHLLVRLKHVKNARRTPYTKTHTQITFTPHLLVCLKHIQLALQCVLARTHTLQLSFHL